MPENPYRDACEKIKDIEGLRRAEQELTRAINLASQRETLTVLELQSTTALIPGIHWREAIKSTDATNLTTQSVHIPTCIAKCWNFKPSKSQATLKKSPDNPWIDIGSMYLAEEFPIEKIPLNLASPLDRNRASLFASYAYTRAATTLLAAEEHCLQMETQDITATALAKRDAWEKKLYGLCEGVKSLLKKLEETNDVATRKLCQESIRTLVDFLQITDSCYFLPHFSHIDQAEYIHNKYRQKEADYVAQVFAQYYDQTSKPTPLARLLFAMHEKLSKVTS